MKRELELYLRNERIVNQKNNLLEKHPRLFMRGGIWCTEYTVHLYTTISGLSLRGKILNFEDGNVETNLVFSTYGDYHLSPEEIQRREKHIQHIKKYGATYEDHR